MHELLRMQTRADSTEILVMKFLASSTVFNWLLTTRFTFHKEGEL